MSFRSRLKRSAEPVRRWLWQARNPVDQSRPAFLVGNGRSGTSMLVFHLARSWQVRLYNEDHPDAFDNYRLRDFEVIQRLVTGSPVALTLFKPIKDTYLAARLLAAFPQGQLLFMFRHFSDVINSARAYFHAGASRPGRLPVDAWMATDFQDYRAAPPPEAARACIRDLWRPDLGLDSKIALHWLFQNRLYFDLGLENDARLRLVSYEALVHDPPAGLQQVCSFLQIDFAPRMLAGIHAASIRRDPPPGLDPYVEQACRQLWSDLQQAYQAQP